LDVGISVVKLDVKVKAAVQNKESDTKNEYSSLDACLIWSIIDTERER